jgi:DNA-binding transcriptional MerR regulator
MGTNVGVCAPEPLLIDVSRAAEVVGVSVGVIRGWVADGLPFVRAGRGGRKMFTRRDLERFIERQKEQSDQS